MVKPYVGVKTIPLVVQWYKRKQSVVKCVAGKYSRRKAKLRE